MNAGGIIDVYYQREMLNDNYSQENYASDLSSKLEGIGATLREIFVRSDEQNEPTHMIADRVARERFSSGTNHWQPLRQGAPGEARSYSKSA